MFISLAVTSKSLGTPTLSLSSENEYCVLATQIGRLASLFFLIISIFFFEISLMFTLLAPYMLQQIFLILNEKSSLVLLLEFLVLLFQSMY